MKIFPKGNWGLKILALILAIVLLSFTGVVIETAMNITFPTLMQEFAISTSTVQWITTGYLLILAIVIYFAMKDALRDTSFRNTPSFMKGNLTNDAAR